jgi:hypothetical protein
MRILSLAALAVALPTVALADADSAYKALRVLGKQLGDTTLNRVVEVRGRNGVPQPDVWKLTATNPGARGGVVEVEVQRGKIISQREPTVRGVAPGLPMDLNKLNLDSDGAFTLANQEMQKRVIAFDRIDYLLRTAGAGTSPVWRMELFDRGSKVATMEISADSGTVLEVQAMRATSNDRDYVTGPRRDVVVDSGRERDRDRGRDGGWSHPGEPFRGVGDFFHRLGKRFERRGTQIKRFFSGDE